MNRDYRIAIIGAGAVGSYFVWGLTDINGIELCLIAEGKRLERLCTNGVTINGEVYKPAVYSPEEAGVQDLVIVATKSNGIADAARMLPALTGDATLVLGAFNGVTGESVLAEAVGWDHVGYSSIVIASKRDENGVWFKPDEIGGFSIDSAVVSEELASALAASRLRYFLVDDIQFRLWNKFASNMANNLPQALVGCDASLYSESEHGLWLADKLWAETRLVAAAEGVELPERTVLFARDLGLPVHAKYSTMQDLDAGRHTEIDLFAGELVQLAAKHGLSAPYAEMTYHIIKAIEEKNDGRFE